MHLSEGNKHTIPALYAQREYTFFTSLTALVTAPIPALLGYVVAQSAHSVFMKNAMCPFHSTLKLSKRDSIAES